VPPASQPTPPAPIGKRSQAPAADAPTLFDSVEPSPAEQTLGPSAATWVDALLTSRTFGSHRSNVRLPRPLADERLRGFLDAIAANNNTITLPALASASGEPAGTLRMTLSVVQRLLNIDGAEILAVRDDGSVVCNVELLALQFDLDLTAAGS
jgi:hypothetical protein